MLLVVSSLQKIPVGSLISNLNFWGCNFGTIKSKLVCAFGSYFEKLISKIKTLLDSSLFFTQVHIVFEFLFDVFGGALCHEILTLQHIREMLKPRTRIALQWHIGHGEYCRSAFPSPITSVHLTTFSQVQSFFEDLSLLYVLTRAG